MTRRSPDAPHAVRDDGQVLTLDVHGCSRDGAMRLVRAATSLAQARGRDRVDVIHGIGGAIETALHAELDRGGLYDVSDAVRLSGRTVLSLPVASRRDTTRITPADLR